MGSGGCRHGPPAGLRPAPRPAAPRHPPPPPADYLRGVPPRVSLRYQDILEQNSALDFDDILNKTVELFQEREDVLEKYAERYLHIHIDEFQATNIAQYVP